MIPGGFLYPLSFIQDINCKSLFVTCIIIVTFALQRYGLPWLNIISCVISSRFENMIYGICVRIYREVKSREKKARIVDYLLMIPVPRRLYPPEGPIYLLICSRVARRFRHRII